MVVMGTQLYTFTKIINCVLKMSEIFGLSRRTLKKITTGVRKRKWVFTSAVRMKLLESRSLVLAGRFNFHPPPISPYPKVKYLSSIHGRQCPLTSIRAASDKRV